MTKTILFLDLESLIVNFKIIKFQIVLDKNLMSKKYLYISWPTDTLVVLLKEDTHKFFFTFFVYRLEMV